jgi:hypothetical protein
MTTYYIYFFVFGVIGYFIVTDNSVARFFFYLGQLIKKKKKKVKWWVLYSPDNPIVRFMIRRRSVQMAKELMKDLKK